VVYVPLFEGFGIPLLEAMHCQVPVLTSQVSSLPEVAGEAALYCNPESIEDIAEGMMKLHANQVLYNKLIENGIQRRAIFSWDKTADLLWKSCIKTLNANTPC
jgi:glycosyltransferase involved in cell wall biosynthesis